MKFPTSFTEGKKNTRALVVFTQADLPNLSPCLSSAWPPYNQADTHLSTLDLSVSCPTTPPFLSQQMSVKYSWHLLKSFTSFKVLSNVVWQLITTKPKHMKNTQMNKRCRVTSTQAVHNSERFDFLIELFQK